MTDQPFTRIIPRREPDGTISHVPLRDGYAVPHRFAADSDAISLDISVDTNGTAHCLGVIVRATEVGGDVTGDTLRRIPIARLVKLAVASAARYYAPIEPGSEPVFHVFRPGPRDAEFYAQYTEDARRPRRGSPLTDDHLQQVAGLYRAALERGDPPTQTIADELHAARSTAARWVSLARERGILGASLPGQAGERRN
jgi:hypothetical protein